MAFRRVLSALLLFWLASVPGVSAQQTDAADVALKGQLDRGKQAINNHQYKEALEAFKSANQLKHDSCSECYFLTAIAYFHMHDQKHAIESCDKAITTADNDALRGLAHNLKGNLLLNTAGDAKAVHQAEEEYQAAVQPEPKAAAFHLSLAKVLLRESKDETAKQQLQECLNCAPDEPTKKEAQKLLAHPERGRQEAAPEFQLTTMQGQQLSLQSLAGRVIVMDFWATWCPPCRESVPELKDLTRKYPTDKLVLISVSADQDEIAWREFVAKKRMDWAQYRDPRGSILELFGIHSFPTYLVIDGDGVVRERIHGLNPQESVVHRLKDVLRQMPQLEGEVRK